jgi:hypothetical protein
MKSFEKGRHCWKDALNMVQKTAALLEDFVIEWGTRLNLP